MGSTASVYQQHEQDEGQHGQDHDDQEIEHIITSHQDSKYSDPDIDVHPLPFSMTHRPPKHQSTKSSKHIALNVAAFLDHQVNQVSLKVADQRSQSVPKICSNSEESPAHNMRQVYSSTQLLNSGTGLATVRSHALRLHSRQKNIYINSSSLKFSANSSTFLHRDKSSDHSSSASVTSASASVSASVNIMNENDSLQLTTTTTPTTSTGITKKEIINPIKKKFNLKLQINDDEDDWIQVDDDDDEAGEIMTPRITKEPLGHDQSYTLTQSGTMFVTGFGEGIGKNGIAIGSKYQTKLPMRERLVFLCQLGHGASSTVYKALDITQLQLVGVKMIPMFDRGKRRQMVRELSALFQMLRKKERELVANPSSSSSSSPTSSSSGRYHVNINFDLKGRKHGTESGSQKQYPITSSSSSSQKGQGQGQGPSPRGGQSGKEVPATGYKLYSQQYIVDFYDAFR
jgi:hypothetical protein